MRISRVAGEVLPAKSVGGDEYDVARTRRVGGEEGREKGRRGGSRA
jgi:hypothetical protein